MQNKINIQRIIIIWLVIVSIVYYLFTQWSYSLSNYYNEVGLVHYENSNFTGAIEYYQKSLKYSPDDSVVLYNLATTQIEQWEYEEGLQNLEKSLENFSFNYLWTELTKNDIYDSQMMAYYYNSDYDKLEKLVDTLLYENKDNLIANYYKADIELNNYEFEAALWYINRYLENDPDDEESKYLKWDILYYQWNYLEAIEYFDTTRNYYSAGFASFYARDFNRAIYYFDKSINQEYSDSIDAQIPDRIENIMRALSYYFLWDYQTSHDIYMTVIENDYQENKYKVIPFFTLVQYHLWGISKEWKNFLEDKVDIDKLIEKESEIQNIFIEKSLSEYSDFLYQNYIYSGK